MKKWILFVYYRKGSKLLLITSWYESTEGGKGMGRTEIMAQNCAALFLLRLQSGKFQVNGLYLFGHQTGLNGMRQWQVL